MTYLLAKVILEALSQNPLADVFCDDTGHDCGVDGGIVDVDGFRGKCSLIVETPRIRIPECGGSNGLALPTVLHFSLTGSHALISKHFRAYYSWRSVFRK